MTMAWCFSAGMQRSPTKSGAGAFTLGLTDTDDVTNAAAGGGKAHAGRAGSGDLWHAHHAHHRRAGEGTQAAEVAKNLIDYLASKQTEDQLID